MSDSLQPNELQHVRLPCPSLSPGICSDYPDGSAVKNPPASVGDLGSIPGSERFPGGRNSSPLQYACLGNPMDRGAWGATVHGVARDWTQFSN